jgi:hypothetical protein
MDKKVEQPKFGDWMRNTHASADNPIRDGHYVRTITRTGRVMNPGTCYELTDGKGKFWQTSPEFLVASPAASEQETCPTCGSKDRSVRKCTLGRRHTPYMDGCVECSDHWHCIQSSGTVSPNVANTLGMNNENVLITAEKSVEYSQSSSPVGHTSPIPPQKCQCPCHGIFMYCDQKIPCCDEQNVEIRAQRKQERVNETTKDVSLRDGNGGLRERGAETSEAATLRKLWNAVQEAGCIIHVLNPGKDSEEIKVEYIAPVAPSESQAQPPIGPCIHPSGCPACTSGNHCETCLHNDFSNSVMAPAAVETAVPARELA